MTPFTNFETNSYTTNVQIMKPWSPLSMTIPKFGISTPVAQMSRLEFVSSKSST